MRAVSTACLARENRCNGWAVNPSPHTGLKPGANENVQSYYARLNNHNQFPGQTLTTRTSQPLADTFGIRLKSLKRPVGAGKDNLRNRQRLDMAVKENKIAPVAVAVAAADCV